MSEVIAMTIVPIVKRCSKCKRKYTWNPDSGKMWCPNCGLFEMQKGVHMNMFNFINVKSSDSGLYGGKTIQQWDQEWVSIGKLKNANLTQYNHSVGLYRHVVHGKTMYVGRAIELHNGGFRKRLSDYRRQSDSARTHTSGRIINENLDDIVTYILVVGHDEQAVEITKKLEGKFIAKYRPAWNKMINI